MRLHSLYDIVQVFYYLVVLFCWGWRYTINILYRRRVPPFLCGGERSPLFSMRFLEKVLKMANALRSVVCCLHSWMSLLKVDVCAKRVIPLDTIITSAIVYTPACTNFLLFSNFSINQAWGSTGSYGPIIFTAFTSMLISSTAH